MSAVQTTVFFLRPEHSEFPANRDVLIAKNKRSGWRMVLLGIGAYFLFTVVAALLVISRVGSLENARGFPLLALLTAILVTGAVLVTNFFLWQTRRFYREGEMLHGSILEVDGRSSQKDGYRVSVRYHFTWPAGVDLSRKQSERRNDLQGHHLPIAGTPVRILYRSDKDYMLL